LKIASRIPVLQNATAEVDDAGARALGINLTDLHCVSLLIEQGPAAAHKLATKLRLTRGAVTVVLDRLARARLAERQPDPEDRRGILVAPTPFARKRVRELWGPLGDEGKVLLAGYSAADLKLIESFLDRATRLQFKHAERIRSSRRSSKATRSKRN